MADSYLNDAIDLNRVKRALVIKLRHHGDVLLASPVFSVLANHISGVEVDALVYAETSAMLEEHPAITEIHSIDRNWKKQGLLAQWQHERQLMTTLQNRHYDLIIHLTEHHRGARLVRRLRPRYAVAQAYPHKRGNWWRKLFTHTYTIPERPRHTVEIHLDALRRLGIYPSNNERNLVLSAGSQAEHKVENLLAQNGFADSDYILIHPTSRWMFKGWSIDGFAATITALHNKGYKLILTSSPDTAEIETVEKIISRTPGGSALNLAGKLSLKELAALIDRASCFIGLDSVPMHIAASMKTPCVALFGPSDDARWAPWQVKHRVLKDQISCRPCNLDGCGNGKVSDCLMKIGSDAVVEATESLLVQSA